MIKMSEEYFAQVITKDEFIKRINELNDTLTKLISRYSSLLNIESNRAKEKQEWITARVYELTTAIVNNKEMMIQAQVESDFLVSIVGEDGSVLLKRVTEREHNEIYKIKRQEYLV